MHRFNYSRTLPQKFPVRAVDIVNPGIQWRFIALTYYEIITIWNFNSLFRVCLIFLQYTILRTSKHREYHPMKKCYSLLRWPCLLQDVLNRRLLFKQTGSSSTKGNHHPSFLRFWIGQKKTVDAAKICGGAENVVKTETQQTFVNGLLGFITLGIYIWLEARIAHNNCMSCPSIWATLSCNSLINILLGSFQLFLHSDQPLSLRVK